VQSTSREAKPNNEQNSQQKRPKLGERPVGLNHALLNRLIFKRIFHHRPPFNRLGVSLGAQELGHEGRQICDLHHTTTPSAKNLSAGKLWIVRSDPQIRLQAPRPISNEYRQARQVYVNFCKL
jgi:hypothetical protein